MPGLSFENAHAHIGETYDKPLTGEMLRTQLPWYTRLQPMETVITQLGKSVGTNNFSQAYGTSRLFEEKFGHFIHSIGTAKFVDKPVEKLHEILLTQDAKAKAEADKPANIIIRAQQRGHFPNNRAEAARVIRRQELDTLSPAALRARLFLQS
ncbi:MAG: hypothetical protein ACI8Y7_000928 [Candidatus Woesearchaeota archaeon]|jgi:hypothetical protein